MITAKDVRHVAKLARLNLTQAETTQFTDQLDRILGYMEQLNEVDTTGIEPMSHPISLVNVLREDEVIHNLDRQTLMANAPVKEGAFFKVPKIGE
jgi:aspartyl-tRNA(Asn)/glutamyl-tRNA(Gln) amidotransferase subunit C